MHGHVDEGPERDLPRRLAAGQLDRGSKLRELREIFSDFGLSVVDLSTLAIPRTDLEDDLESGYVRVLQEMIAAGWSSVQVGDAVRELLGGWFTLLAEV